MPCACTLPAEIYPEASEWGPILWRILHGLAEKVGLSAFPQYYSEERRYLVKLFKLLERIIPCPSCKEHYEVYLRQHPVDGPIKDLSHSELNTYVKTWFWQLHNWVNESIGHAIFSYEELSIYKKVNIRDELKNLDIPMRRAIRIRSGHLISYIEFINQVKLLLSVY